MSSFKDVEAEEGVKDKYTSGHHWAHVEIDACRKCQEGNDIVEPTGLPNGDWIDLNLAHPEDFSCEPW
ncbi:predicted protein [Botrytis cinerea T4]|uniref:Uncharacterized protein n=1 Tax=Botryotinia fuckeliana (strain T4) TaxID=999810 RepID=G2Y4T2_BOTF4|nr:predicted protein [Botrytis cinerea T4]